VHMPDRCCPKITQATWERDEAIMTIRAPSRAADLRQINRARILAEIRHAPGVSRRQLARLTKLTEASLSRIVRELIDSHLVRETEPSAKAQRGRPEVGLFLDPVHLYVLAVCISTYERKLSLVGITGERLWECDVPFSNRGTAEGLLQHVAARFEEARSSPDLRLKRALGVAFALSDTEAFGAGLMSELHDYSQSAGLNLPLYAANITSALHLAEAHSVAGGPVSNSLLIHAGLDIGATLIIDGILRPHASDLDHAGRIAVRTRTEGKERQTIGVLADVASGKAILDRLGSSAITDTRLAIGGLKSGMPHAIRQANSGDRKAVGAFEEAGEAIAIAYAATASLIRLEQIILAGPLASAAPFMRAFCQVFETIFEGQPNARPKIYRSRTSDLKAAEHMALKHFIFDPQARQAPRSGGD
jgi:predicted NBD/HSP70 family sugar kinase